MSRVRNSVQRLQAVPGLTQNLLVIAVLFALGLAVGGYILVKQRIVFPWEDRISFSAEFDSVPGISPGNGQELRVAGVTVGEITGAEVTDDGRARLTLTMDPDAATIYENAEIELRPKSPLNEMFVNVINVGTPDAGTVEGGETLVAASDRDPIQVDEVLSHLDTNAREAAGVLLAELDLALVNAPETLPAGVVATDATLEGLESLSNSLVERRALLAQLVTGLADVSTGLGQDDERLRDLVGHATDTLGALAAQDEALREVLGQFPGLTDDLGDATEGLIELTSQLDPTLDDLRAAADALPPALAGVRETVDRLDRTVDLARPFLTDARPIVGSLRATAVDLRPAIADLRALTPLADPATSALIDYLPDLADFTYNTNSAMSLEDSTGPILRGLLQVTPESLGIPNPLDNG